MVEEPNEEGEVMYIFAMFIVLFMYIFAYFAGYLMEEGDYALASFNYVTVALAFHAYVLLMKGSK